MVWQPAQGEEQYYSTPAPADSQGAFGQLLAQVTRAGADPTFGRSTLPRSPLELALTKDHPWREGKVLTGKQDGSEWVSYQVWEPRAGVPLKDADLLFIHGINDYGGKFATHADLFLDAGYRLLIPDLPSHGRSTGIHCYVPDMEALADAVYAVLSDVLLEDSKLVKSADGSFKQRRKIFVAGQSLGGFTAALTCLKYGSLDSAETTELKADDSFKPKISGGCFLCPMLAINPETMPAYPVQLLARGIASFAGPLPLASANKGKNSEDPDVEEQFQRDPQTYHGKLRVGTGLAILSGLIDINKNMEALKIPFIIHHGTGDRVTSYHGSEKLYASASSTDKELKLYEGYEHILLRKGRDEQDDHRRQTVLKDMLEWLEKH
ncbi:lysophospholipase [Leucosporidium creatinivorum]|uniref:Lysophospholipase n=1 Tax=Leucosporidium creatinivorum TaxID=106004 RepID=A0A1Y2G2K4_9BASI|nr:lysophospholipase [Leucosporidium creatinivorum]